MFCLGRGVWFPGVHDRSDIDRTVTAFENVVKRLADEGDLAGC